MRAIKFRAWHKTEKSMLKPGDKYGTSHDLDCVVYFQQGQPVELMQYTELKDKNGKEIYEGDILKNGSTYGNDPSRFEVVWNEREGAFNGKVGVGKLPLSCAYWFYGNCEVIGNIYENKDLLND